jgi:hypothetical protein
LTGAPGFSSRNASDIPFSTGLPHLAQNFAFPSITEPQLWQNFALFDTSANVELPHLSQNLSFLPNLLQQLVQIFT